MPDRDKCIPPVPRIDPDLWEDFEGFRETFLFYVRDSEANRCLRLLGRYLYNLLLETREPQGEEDAESSTRIELEAALADLRHEEGFLKALGREQTLSSLSETDIALSQVAAREALVLGESARRIEEALGR